MPTPRPPHLVLGAEIKAVAAPKQPSRTIPAPGGRAGSAHPKLRALSAATCLSAHPIRPPERPLSRLLPCPLCGWTCSSTILAGSPAHPTAPGAAPCSVTLQGFPGRGFPGPKVHSFPAAKGRTIPGCAMRSGMLCRWGCLRRCGISRPRRICVSEDLLFCRSLPTAASLRDQLGTFAEFAKSLLRVPAQPPHFPESEGGGSSFHNKSPSPGSGSHSRLKQGPRC